MRTTIVLAGMLLATAHLTPAVAEDSIVNGKPCNATCRSWLGLPATPAPDGPREPPAAPPPPHRVTQAERPPAPPLPPEQKTSSAASLSDDAKFNETEPLNRRVNSITTLTRATESKGVDQTVMTSDAHDVSTPIVGNPRWKQYTDSVFHYKGTLFAEDYERAHPAPPSTSAGLRVSR